MNDIANGEALLSTKSKRDPRLVIVIIIEAFLIALVLFYYFIGFSPIKGESMMNTLQDGQCVILLRRGYELSRGDMVTLDSSETTEEHVLIKRVIGLGGDRLLFVKTADNKYVDLYLCKNGESRFTLLDEPYIKERMVWNGSYSLYEKVAVIDHIEQNGIENIDLYAEYTDETEKTRKYLLESAHTVPQNSFFFLGDNINHSNDSRHYGDRALSKIYGKVISAPDVGSALEKFMRFLFRV